MNTGRETFKVGAKSCAVARAIAGSLRRPNFKFPFWSSQSQAERDNQKPRRLIRNQINFDSNQAIDLPAHGNIITIEVEMAPPLRPDEESTLPNTPEYNEFIAKLTVYHEKRGTNFDPAPRVGSKQIDLLKLYNVVVGRGGYDAVSDEKLAWRKVGEEFNLGQANLPALAFALKTTFYKYLSAYWISTYGKEPPPREILEDQTAKGSGLLTRTMENYRPSNRRETGALGNENSEASGDDGTPSRDRHGSEEAPGSGGRVTRGLRQAPPQRILFQPDTQPSRQSRHATATSHPPSSHQQQNQQFRGASTSYNPPANMENMSPAVANYEPRPQMPLTLRTVITPGNNPIEWTRRQRLMKEHNGANGRLPPPKVVLPGSKFCYTSGGTLANMR